MELKPGYKKTEVGMLPEEWRVEPLGDVGKWLSGGTPSMSEESYWNGDIPWVSPKDMKVARLHDSIDHVSERSLGNGTRVAPRGAVLMVVRGMILAHSFPVARAERPLAFNQDIKALVVRAGVESDFVLRWLQASEMQLLSVANESTHGTKRIPSEALFAQKLVLPPVPEQRAIAAALNDVDALIGALDSVLAKKRDLKQAAMQRLLTGKRRLPEFVAAEARYKETEVGAIPEEWEQGRVCNLASITTGAKNTQDRIEDGLYPFFVRSSTVERINSYSFDGEAVLTAGDGVGTGKVFHYIKGKFDCHQRVYRIARFLERVDGYFFFLYFSTHFYDRIMGMTAKSSVDSVRREMIADMIVPLPPLNEQRAIAAVLSDMDAEIAALEARRDKTRALKQGMMQELLTGRTRLVDSGQ